MIDGSILIGAQTRKHEGGFQAVNPATGDSFGRALVKSTHTSTAVSLVAACR